MLYYYACLTLHSTCFLPWYKLPNSDQLMRMLSGALPNGALISSLTPGQVKELMMTLWEEYL